MLGDRQSFRCFSVPRCSSKGRVRYQIQYRMELPKVLKFEEHVMSGLLSDQSATLRSAIGEKWKHDVRKHENSHRTASPTEQPVR